MSETFEMVAKTLYGLEEILAGELLSLGANDIQIGRLGGFPLPGIRKCFTKPTSIAVRHCVS